MMTGRQFQEWMDDMGWSKARAGRELGVHANTITRYLADGAPLVVKLACLALYQRGSSVGRRPWNP